MANTFSAVYQNGWTGKHGCIKMTNSWQFIHAFNIVQGAANGGEGREEEHLFHCILLQGANEGKSVFEVYHL